MSTVPPYDLKPDPFIAARRAQLMEALQAERLLDAALPLAPAIAIKPLPKFGEQHRNPIGPVGLTNVSGGAALQFRLLRRRRRASRKQRVQGLGLREDNAAQGQNLAGEILGASGEVRGLGAIGHIGSSNGFGGQQATSTAQIAHRLSGGSE